MSAELFWLTLTVVMTGVLWIPFTISRISTRGVFGALAKPTPNSQAVWADRLKESHQKLVENLVVFVPLVLILDSIGVSTGTTSFACAAYFWAWLAYIVIRLRMIPILRVFAFAVAFLAQVVLALAVFGLA